MTFFDFKFMRRVAPPNHLPDVSHDGAGGQPDRRRVRDESSAGPRQLFTVPPAQPPRRKQSPLADFNPNAVGGTPREGGAFTVPPPETGGSARHPVRASRLGRGRDGGPSFPPWDGGDPLVITLAVAGMTAVAPVSYRKTKTYRGLDGLAALLGEITYGEMYELAAAIFKAKGDRKAITRANLAAMLHGWAMRARA